MTESFPLKWPLGRSITDRYRRKDARFNTTMGRSRDELLHELKLLGARNVVISSNVATYTRGGQTIMYADQSAAKDEPGVAVYYTWKDNSYALACDRWKTVADNLQALNKTVNAIRGLDRWGTGEMVKAAFAGFKELGAPETDFWEILGIPATKSKEQINTAYRAKAKELFHNGTSLKEINIARDKAIKYAG